jgi:signal transduction histidine kinase
MYIISGAGLAGWTPFLYSILSFLSLAHFCRGQRFEFFRRAQLSLILLIPFLVQTALGGYHAASVVVVWSVLAPMAALLFVGADRSKAWFAAFAAILAIAGLLEGTASRWAVPFSEHVRNGFLVMNFVGVWSVIYGLIRHFVVKMEQLEAEKSAQAINLMRLEEMDRRNKELIQSDQLKDDLLSAVSHELRTPLTSILGYLTLLTGEKTGLREEPQRDYAVTALQNAHRLHKMVNDLLDFSRLSSRRIAMNLVVVRPIEVAERALIELKVLAQKNTLRIALKAPDPSLSVMADPDRLEQVIVNLLGNAFKFTPEGGAVTLGVERCERGGRSGVLIWVRDSGIGIPAEDLPRVFERFYQVDQTAQRQYGGTGLGLPISQEIVKAHGGEIWAESRPGNGSTFYVFLPHTEDLSLGSIQEALF